MLNAQISLHFMSHHDVLHSAPLLWSRALLAQPAAVSTNSPLLWLPPGWFTNRLLLCLSTGTSCDSVLWLKAKAHHIIHHQQCLYCVPFGCFILFHETRQQHILATLTTVCAFGIGPNGVHLQRDGLPCLSLQPLQEQSQFKSPTPYLVLACPSRCVVGEHGAQPCACPAMLNFNQTHFFQQRLLLTHYHMITPASCRSETQL